MRILPNERVPEPDRPQDSPHPQSDGAAGIVNAAASGDPSDWSRTWTARIGERLRAARLAAGLSTQQVADRTAELGYPMARASIGNLETRPREKIYLQDITVLAAALGVSPMEILYPLDVDVSRSATPTPVGVVRRGVLRNSSMEMLPGRVERAPAAAGWFTGGYGRILEARLAAITAYGKFEARFALLSMLNEESKAGTLAARLHGPDAPSPAALLNVLWMEVYDLARWALDAIEAHDNLAATAGDPRAAVDDRERALIDRSVSSRPPGYIADPHKRPFLQGALTVGVPEPGGTPYYLQDAPDDRWTPADLTRPATAYGATEPDRGRSRPAPTGHESRRNQPPPSFDWPTGPSAPEYHGPDL